MRIIPRRKRTWALVLAMMAVVFGGAVWWIGTRKSDFERRYEQLKLGMSFEEVVQVMKPIPKPALTMARRQQVLHWSPVIRLGWADGGEKIFLEIDGDRLTAKELTPLSTIEGLRRFWLRKVRSKPPF